MMRLPGMKNLTEELLSQTEFRGLNETNRIGDSEFSDTENTSAAAYPALSTRKRRGHLKTFTAPNALFAADRLTWVDKTQFYYNGVLKGTVTDSEKQLVQMGAYTLIFPDKKYYDAAADTFGSLEAEFTTVSDTVFTLAREDGEAYSYAAAATAPENPENGACWLDTSVSPNVLKQYSDAEKLWYEVAMTFVKLSSPGIGTLFSKYDGVTITGCTDPAFNGDFLLYGAGENEILISAVLTSSFTQSAGITVSRSVPDMDFVTEYGNRVFGCSSVNHEIYASKLGDPKNFHCFMGISTDSYAVTVGSAGDFTGAAVHLGNVLFFKEDVIHKLYGTRPANFQLTETPAPGVERGSEKSLAQIGGTLYYKSRSGICGYEGGLPFPVSAALSEGYHHAVGGALGNVYYVSMEKDGSYFLFSYDTRLSAWHREDSSEVRFFAPLAGELYFISGNTLKSVTGKLSIFGDGVLSEESMPETPVSWHADTGDLLKKIPEKKALRKLSIRLYADTGSTVKVYLSSDGGKTYREKLSYTGDGTQVVNLPVIPERGSRLRLRLSGEGYAEISGIYRYVEKGSEL